MSILLIKYYTSQGMVRGYIISLVQRPSLTRSSELTWCDQAEEKYGTPAWNAKWSLLYTDGELIWVNPLPPSSQSDLI
jgi:hypothetical protein